MKERDELGDPSIDGSLILKWNFRKWYMEGVDWIELAEVWDSWRTLVNAVMNLRVPYNVGNFLSS